MTNVNPETGIRYGIIAAMSLHDEIIDDIYTRGVDVHWEEAREEMEQGIRNACEGLLHKHDIQAVVDEAHDRMTGDQWYDDEPVYEFVIDGVKGRTTWLGGALLVWVFESPFLTRTKLCSPCVPNCGDLDSVDDEGEECYDVPPDWRIK